MADRAKTGTAFTTSVTVVVWVKLPLVPVMVSTDVPAAADADTFTVIFDVPAPVMKAGLNVAVTPAGNPLTLRDTAPEKPLLGEVETV